MRSPHHTASSAALSGQLVVYGTSTLTGNVHMDAKLNVAGASTFVSSVTAKADTRFGDSTANLHAFNRDVEAGVALAVDGPGTSGSYPVKFYSGGVLVGGFRKK